MPHERRRHVRKRVDLPCTFSVGGETLEAHLSDMCPGGAFIATEVVPDFGTEVVLRWELAGKPLEIKVTVRWAKPGGMGVQFGLLGVRDTFAITEFLKDLPDCADARGG